MAYTHKCIHVSRNYLLCFGGNLSNAPQQKSIRPIEHADHAASVKDRMKELGTYRGCQL